MLTASLACNFCKENFGHVNLAYAVSTLMQGFLSGGMSVLFTKIMQFFEEEKI